MEHLLFICAIMLCSSSVSGSPEVCTNSLLPGAKGDQGQQGEDGAEGKLGKQGPPGVPGQSGDSGAKGETGPMGKMGPAGGRGEKGDTGLNGPEGFKGKPGTTCDCGRYRKVVGMLDVNIGKLRKAVKFVKNVALGLRETEERYYLLVKEPKRFKEASVNCKLRGGSLAMPKNARTNRLLADYVSQAGLSGVYVGVKSESKDGRSSYVYADSSPVQGFSALNQEQVLQYPSFLNTSWSCVELLSTGRWGHVECEVTTFFVCEFVKSRRSGAEVSPSS